MAAGGPRPVANAHGRKAHAADSSPAGGPGLAKTARGGDRVSPARLGARTVERVLGWRGRAAGAGPQGPLASRGRSRSRGGALGSPHLKPQEGGGG